jgi:hypothetical protein
MIFFLFFHPSLPYAQETEPESESAMEEQLENLAEKSDTDTEDDSYLQQLKHYLRHPLNLNEATATDLAEFKLLSALQIQNFVAYRNLFGSFINLYELQAVPSWDMTSIRKLLPYIIISDSKTISRDLSERLFVGDNSLLFRVSMTLPKSKGYFREDSASNFYIGSRPHLLVRYRYNYKNLLQYGFVADKDAGEQFFKGSQRGGFDFYSFHFFMRKSGIVRSLAIGDFTVNLGQGLIHWQSLAFKKSVSIVSIKRQTEALRPYSSSGESDFHRGAGITLLKKNWETTVFASIRKLNAIIRADSGQHGKDYVSSLLNSGYHRTPSELEHRNNLQSYTVGSSIKYNVSRWHAGINCVQYFFSKPFKASDKPYDLFALTGNKWTNFSFDYGYTFRNMHMFGEVAADKNFNTAIIKGMLVSLDRSADLAIVYRRIEKRYQSFYGNAFTENSSPSNETGLYTSISIRPSGAWRIDAYADFYKFPWLLFQADSPSYGSDYLLQVTFVPNKQVTISLRFKRKVQEANIDTDLSTSPVSAIPKRNLRYHLSYNMNREVLINNRVEVLWYEKDAARKQNGYLMYADIRYKPCLKPYSANTRLQYFETNGYNTRIYAYENDVLYGYSTPAFFEKGFRWYFNIKTDVSEWRPFKQPFKIEMWIKYAITHYFELDKIGTELDEIQGKNRSEIKFQLLFSR